MSALETARQQIKKAAVHLSRVYPTDQLAECKRDVQDMLFLDVPLPPSEIEEQTLSQKCSDIVASIQVAEIALQQARHRIASLKQLLDTL